MVQRTEVVTAEESGAGQATQQELPAPQVEQQQQVQQQQVQQQQAPQQQQGVEPEELLKKLYDPLLRRLKAELWLDRERRGLLTDRWH
ncbi:MULTISPECIES: hypothetical protein [unclassified Saccharothrix]|uniref:hypothetical protein n=1 Tax=unclassified Saccharothrix TaxID=2593673 RepID=UPI00307EA957